MDNVRGVSNLGTKAVGKLIESVDNYADLGRSGRCSSGFKTIRVTKSSSVRSGCGTLPLERGYALTECGTERSSWRFKSTAKLWSLCLS